MGASAAPSPPPGSDLDLSRQVVEAIERVCPAAVCREMKSAAEEYLALAQSEPSQAAAGGGGGGGKSLDVLIGSELLSRKFGVAEFLEFFDKNGDGELDIEEFIAGMRGRAGV